MDGALECWDARHGSDGECSGGRKEPPKAVNTAGGANLNISLEQHDALDRSGYP